jgi:hypothetical protein
VTFWVIDFVFAPCLILISLLLRSIAPHWLLVFRWANGNMYDGEWMEGKQHGNGIKTSVRANVPNN